MQLLHSGKCDNHIFATATDSVHIQTVGLPEFVPLEYIAFCSRLTTRGNIRLKTKMLAKLIFYRYRCLQQLATGNSVCVSESAPVCGKFLACQFFAFMDHNITYLRNAPEWHIDFLLLRTALHLCCVVCVFCLLVACHSLVGRPFNNI